MNEVTSRLPQPSRTLSSSDFVLSLLENADDDGNITSSCTTTIAPRKKPLVTVLHNDERNDNKSKKGKDDDGDICGVCRQQISKYTCPRCQVRYCSLDCYKNHTKDIGSTEEGMTSSSTSSCTEQFYQNRVNAILQLERLERKEATEKMLRRQYQQQYNDQYKSDHVSLLPDGKYVHYKQDNDNDNDDDRHYDDREILYHLLQKLEGNDQQDQQEQYPHINNGINNSDDNDLEMEELLSMIPHHLKVSFLRDLQTGSILSNELVLKRWHPWWRTELTNINPNDSTYDGDNDGDNDDGDNDDDDNHCENEPYDKNGHGTERNEWKAKRKSRIYQPTLDERLLQVPKFTSLRRRQNPSEPSPNLLFNLIDILYAICWTLRLYHGIDNILSSSLPRTSSSSTSSSQTSIVIEAASTLLSASYVLAPNGSSSSSRSKNNIDKINNDGDGTNKNTPLFFTSIEEVLTQCTSWSTQQYKSTNNNSNNSHVKDEIISILTASRTSEAATLGCNADWETLADDCALLLVSHRLVGRALLEAMDILKLATKQLKEEQKVQQEQQQSKTTRSPTASVAEDKKNNSLTDSIQTLRKVRKKLEYYLSWSIHHHQQEEQLQHSNDTRHFLFGNELRDAITTWINHWKYM